MSTALIKRASVSSVPSSHHLSPITFTDGRMSVSPAIPLPPLSRVAVIGGGGPSGLVAVKQLLDAGVRADQIAAFDDRPAAGGVWNYVADPGTPDIAWRKNGMAVMRSEREKALYGALGPGGELLRMLTADSRHLRPPPDQPAKAHVS